MLWIRDIHLYNILYTVCWFNSFSHHEIILIQATQCEVQINWHVAV